MAERSSLSVCVCAKCASVAVYTALYEAITGVNFDEVVQSDSYARNKGIFFGPQSLWNVPNTLWAHAPGDLHVIIRRDPVERYLSAFFSKFACCDADGTQRRKACYSDYCTIS